MTTESTIIIDFSFYLVTDLLRKTTTPDLLLVKQLQHLEPNGHV